MSDNINPDHYKRLPAEAIEIIESAIDNAPSAKDAYLHGQVLKYVLRCWNKNGIEDLKKAKWYLDRLIGSLESDEQQKAADLQSLKDHPFGKLKQPVVKESLTAKPDPGEGFRLLSKNPPERLLDTDEGLFSIGLDGGHWLSVNYSSGEQLPSVYYRRRIEPLKQQTEPPDGWRWLEVGEVIRKGDEFFLDGDWWDYDSSIGEKLLENMWPSIRRNRFEVGEKVVHVDDRHATPYEIDEYIYSKDAYVVKYKNGHYMYHWSKLAPYIEEAK